MALTTVILPWDSLVLMTAALILATLAVLVEVGLSQTAAQAPTHVEQRKEIVTMMTTALAV